MPTEPAIGQIPVSQLSVESVETNVATPTPSIAGDSPKLSFEEFNGDSPRNNSKLEPVPKGPANKDKAIVSDVAKDTNNNEPPQETESLEKETPDKEGTEPTAEGEEPVIEETPQGEDKEVKVHGNDKRDYTGLTAQEIKVLKRLDNPRFNALMPILKAKTEAANKAVALYQELEKTQKLLKEGGVPSSWHEHPEAYQLSPAYKQLDTQYGQYEIVENHYEQQLLNIKLGKPWTSLTFNQQTGQFQQSAPHEASEQSEIWVSRQFNTAAQHKAQLEAKGAMLKEQFSGEYSRAKQHMEGEVSNLVSKLHPDIKPQTSDVESAKKAIPQQYKDHPLYEAVSTSLAVIIAQGRKLKEFYGAQQTTQRVQQDRAKAGNVIPPRTPSVAASSNGKLSMKDFQMPE